MKRVGIVLLVMVAFAVIGITGCKKQAETASGDGPLTLKLRFNSSWKGTSDENIKRWFEAEYKKDHPNISIEFNYFVQNELLSSILAQHAAGGADDAIFMIPVAAAPVLAGPGAIADITNFMKDSPMGKPDYFFDLVNFSCIIDGKWYAIPFSVDGMMLMYNTEMLAEWGVQPPKTIPEMMEIMEIAKKRGATSYAYPMGQVSAATHSMGNFFHSEGGEYVKSDGKGWYTPVFEGPIAEEHIQRVRDLQQYMPTDTITYDWLRMYAAFAERRIAMFFVGPWINAQIGRIIPEDFPLAVVPVPAGKKNSSTPLGGWIYTLNADYNHQKEAFDLVEFLNRPQISAECTAGMSGVRDAFNFAPMNEEKTLRFRGALEVARPILQDGCPLGTTVEEGFGAVFNQVLFEPTPNLRSDAAFLNNELQKILDANKPR